MIDVLFNKKNYGPIAQEYNELSGGQLLRIAAIFVQPPRPELAVLKAMRVLLQMSFTRFHLLPPDLKYNLIPAVGWVFEKNGLTAQLLPVYKGLHGPAGEFDNLTMAEWNACEQYYAQHLQGDTEALHSLIAVLYRKPKAKPYNRRQNPDGDVREAFNAHTIATRARKVRRWPVTVKTAILMWYDGCRQQIFETYEVGGGEGGEGQSDGGMFEIMRNLALAGTYGDFEAVQHLNVHIAMREMELLKREDAERQRQIDEMNAANRT